MAVNDQFRIVLLILLPHAVSVSGIQHIEVSCAKQKICALRESTLIITCSYSNINITTGFWFNLKDKAKWWNEDHPEDLTLDSDYAGRVNYTKMTNFTFTLIIWDLRERDSGEYHLMFITDKGEEYRSSDGVTLTVTDLQVTLDAIKHELTCKTSCLLTIIPQQYYWYHNGQWIREKTDKKETFSLNNEVEGSLFCTVWHEREIFSVPLCVGKNCWNVNYTDKRVCALEGSSVELTGIYSYPNGLSVTDAFWHSYKNFNDLKMEIQFANRVVYVKQDQNCTMKINNLTKKDSGEYRLRLMTYRSVKFSGKPGVVLSVTDLQVRVSHSAVKSEGQTPVTLSCITSCTLSNNPTYMWYKDGYPVTNKLTKRNEIYLNSSEDTGGYSCAVRGHENLRPPDVIVTFSEVGPDEADNRISIIVGVTVFLLVIIITGALCMWRKKTKSAHIHSSNKETGPQSEQADEVHYSSIHFPSHTQGSSLSKFCQDVAEYESVQYAAVKISTADT